MSFAGTFVNGKVEFNEPPPFAEGTVVEVVARPSEPAEEAASELGAMLLRHAGKAKGLPPDVASQHDHYLYGTSER